MQKFWQKDGILLQALSGSEQSEIYADMRRNASANVDFHILILLASGIAFFG